MQPNNKTIRPSGIRACHFTCLPFHALAIARASHAVYVLATSPPCCICACHSTPMLYMHLPQHPHVVYALATACPCYICACHTSTPMLYMHLPQHLHVVYMLAIAPACCTYVCYCIPMLSMCLPQHPHDVQALAIALQLQVLHVGVTVNWCVGCH